MNINLLWLCVMTLASLPAFAEQAVEKFSPFAKAAGEEIKRSPWVLQLTPDVEQVRSPVALRGEILTWSVSKQVALGCGANNMADRNPPRVLPQSGDPLGRHFFVAVTARF